jgi:hypothetical protein
MQPFLFYILFMSYYLFLTKYAAKPISQSNRENTGVVITIFQNASMLVWMAGAIALFALNMKHEQWLSDPEKLCGPFPNQSSFERGMITRFSNKDTWVSYIYNSFTTFSVFALVVISMITFRSFSVTVESLLKTFVDQQIKSYQNEEMELNRLLNKK